MILIILYIGFINFVLYCTAGFFTIQLAKTSYEETGIVSGSWESYDIFGQTAIVFIYTLTVINIGLIMSLFEFGKKK